MDVVIIGAGGHGKVVLDILRILETNRVAGFVDADPALVGTSVNGLAVLGGINQLSKLRQQKIKGAIVAIGDNRTRVEYAKQIIEAGLELINAVHPTASVSRTAKVGRNVTIAAGAMVCVDAKISDSVILNTGCIIDHECEVGEGSHICPGAVLAGRVRIGAGAFVGIGANVIQCLSVGENAIIGGGAVVIRDVAPGAKVVGVPGRVIN